MIVHQGIYLPDGETHLTGWMDKAGEIVDGKGTYQIKKLRAALSHCKSFRHAVDIGAHVGFWTMQLAKKFERVDSFEPVANHRACFAKNVNMANVTLHSMALGEKRDSISIVTEPTSSGDSRVAGPGDIPMKTLDDFGFDDIDFIKIDTEGFELYVVRGAEQTVKRCRPVMIVEQKGHGMKYFGFGKHDAIELLESWGMKRVQELSGDFVMAPGPDMPVVEAPKPPEEVQAKAPESSYQARTEVGTGEKRVGRPPIHRNQPVPVKTGD